LLVLTPQTTQSLGPLTRKLACVIFVQAKMPVGESPILIEGTRDPAARLREIDRDSPVETYWIGMIPSESPFEHATALGEQFATARTRHDWFAPTVEVLLFVQHVAQRPLLELLAQLRPHSQPEGAITVDELAEYLGISVPTVRRLVKDGKIPVMRAGNQLRFFVADVVASLQRGSR
jgi:excisionase family DNA binding protein